VNYADIPGKCIKKPGDNSRVRAVGSSEKVSLSRGNLAQGLRIPGPLSAGSYQD
jgi:hypothetical protein